MEKRELLYEGKTKQVFATDNQNFRIFAFKDEATAFNGLKKGKISGKGVINNKISSILMRVLEREGVPTHFVKEISDREQIVKAVSIMPIEVLVRNVAAGTLSKRLGLPEGLIPLSEAVIYVCEAEKSNTVVEAMYSAESDAINVKDDNIPAHLKNYEFASKEDKKNKMGYKYPHDFGGYVEQQYLPDGLKDRVYYSPKNNGYEQTIKQIRAKKGKKV